MFNDENLTRNSPGKLDGCHVPRLAMDFCNKENEIMNANDLSFCKKKS